MGSPFFRNNEGGGKKNLGHEEWTGPGLELFSSRRRTITAEPGGHSLFGSTEMRSATSSRLAITAFRSHHLPSNVRCENDLSSDSTITVKRSFYEHGYIVRPLPTLGCVLIHTTHN